jgi:lysozyme
MLAGPDAYRLIKHFESLRLTSYLDPKGVVTVGYGHTGDDVHHPSIITREEAERLLNEDVHYFETKLLRMLKRDPTQNQFDAMISWIFNIGEDRAGKSTLIKFYNLGQDNEASTEFLRWSNITIKGKPVRYRGLVNRRQAERELFLTGKMSF